MCITSPIPKQRLLHASVYTTGTNLKRPAINFEKSIDSDGDASYANSTNSLVQLKTLSTPLLSDASNQRPGYRSFALHEIWVPVLAAVACLNLFASLQQESGLNYHWHHVVHRFFLTWLFVRSVWRARIKLFNESRETVINKEKVLLFLFSLSCSLVLLPFFCAKSSNAVYSVIELILQRIFNATMVTVRSRAKGEVIRLSKRAATTALIRPFQFHDKIRQTMTVIRWAKFLTPLLGTCNKLKEHCLDLHKKRINRQRRQKALLTWSKLLDTMSEQQRLQRAVLRIQTNFRKKKIATTKTRILLLKNRAKTNRELTLNIRSRLRIEAAQTAQHLTRTGKVMSERSKRREITHDDKEKVQHHTKEARKNRKLLLQPNTTFSLVWKAVTVTCVAFEVATIALAPKLTGKMQKMSLDRMIRAILLPSSITDNTGGASTRHPMVGILYGPIFFHTDQVHKPEDIGKTFWAISVHYLAGHTTSIAGIISFLDVFVTFFTGELDKTTRMLVHKPFLRRWILPGIALQLLVNPTMRHIYKFVKQYFQFTLSIGVARVFHILSALWPIIILTSSRFLDIVHYFVERENMKLLAVMA